MNTEATMIVAVVIVAVILAVVVAVLLRVLLRSASPFARISSVVSALVLIVLSPLAVDELVASLNRTRGAAHAMIDPGWAMKFAPAVVAAIVAGTITIRAHTRAR